MLGFVSVLVHFLCVDVFSCTGRYDSLAICIFLFFLSNETVDNPKKTFTCDKLQMDFDTEFGSFIIMNSKITI